MNFVFEDLVNEENFINCPDVNPSGIKRFTSSPIASTMIRFARNKEHFKNLKFKHVQCSDNPNAFDRYIIASGVAHHPNDWTGPNNHNANKQSLFSYLNPTYLRDLRTGKAFLLLDQSHEGYHEGWLYKWFHKECATYLINPKQIMYVTGNLEAADQYAQWCSDNGIVDKMCIAPFPIFENAVYTNNLNRVRIFNLDKLPTVQTHIKYKEKNLDKIKLYNALQKRSRAHRMWLFKDLYQAGLIPDGINSMNSFTQLHTHYMGKVFEQEEYDEVAALLPMLPPFSGSAEEELKAFSNQDSGKYQMEFNPQICLDSWFTVISEASFGEETCFISEKTFKLLCVQHPFIIYGNKHSLHYLKDMGYKTFSPFIDETYDNLDTWERLEAIINSIKKIKAIPQQDRLKWFSGMQDILEHNYETIKNNSLNKAPNAMIKIDNYFKGLDNV